MQDHWNQWLNVSQSTHSDALDNDKLDTQQLVNQTFRQPDLLRQFTCLTAHNFLKMADGERGHAHKVDTDSATVASHCMSFSATWAMSIFATNSVSLAFTHAKQFVPPTSMFQRKCSCFVLPPQFSPFLKLIFKQFWLSERIFWKCSKA